MRRGLRCLPVSLAKGRGREWNAFVNDDVLVGDSLEETGFGFHDWRRRYGGCREEK
jgi:hypothetical protein